MLVTFSYRLMEQTKFSAVPIISIYLFGCELNELAQHSTNFPTQRIYISDAQLIKLFTLVHHQITDMFKNTYIHAL
jgi:hypothetical protein